MPATEQTWREQKRMHLIFGITGTAMLATTVWMLAADHDREWKPYQRKFREVEAWYAQARIDQTADDEYAAKSDELRRAVLAAKAAPPAQEQVQRFIELASHPQIDQKEGPELSGEIAEVTPAYEALVNAAQSVPAPAAPHDEADGDSDESGSCADETTDGADEGAEASAVGEVAPASASADGTATLAQTAALRSDFDEALRTVVTRVRFFEDEIFASLKFKKADLDVVKSRYSIAVGEGKSAEELGQIEIEVQAVQKIVDELTVRHQNAKTWRLSLEEVVAEMNAGVDQAEKNLADHLGDLDRLEKVKAEQELTAVNWVGGVLPMPGKTLLDLPILDPFNGPLKIQQIWLPNLTLNNNFKDVARFDRCITCHLGIDRTAPGSAVDAAYPLRSDTPIELSLATPETAPEIPDEGDAAQMWKIVAETYGFELAQQGLISETEATVAVVHPRSPAANAMLQVGDVIYMIDDVKILNREMALTYLVEVVEWGQPLKLQVKRGVPHPFSSHPRLDLFVGSLSPHKMMDMGCTICHEGQGSATTFQWASHTPNDPQQTARWERDHGWFNNHHWILPMRPARFAESSCLKCHHQVTELEPSEKFPEPPAPKVMAGYHLIEDYGCFGCHEILGYAGAKSIGPDLRLEPNFASAAAEILYDDQINDDERRLAQELVDHPDRDSVRKRLSEMLLGDGPPGEATPDEDADSGSGETRALRAQTVELAKLIQGDPESPGKYRKVGPSLRYVASKVELPFLYSWIEKPADFRPTTKMPQFFGLWEHLEVDPDKAGLEESKRFEPIELRAVSEYLLKTSQPFAYASQPAGVTVQPSADRGKTLFNQRGCLACHEHKDFPEMHETQGPDLSRIGDKLAGNPNGAKWLYTWLSNPMQYHARTFMPNMLLEPITQPDGQVSDPAADIAAFLMGSGDGWKPAAVPEVDGAALDDLAAMYLGGSFTVNQITSDTGILKQGIPESMAKQTRGAEAFLLGMQDASDEEKLQKKLLYVGHRTIARLGCYGCHDIPGFEDGKPIGTGLADWGRKDPSTLAFEQIGAYLEAQVAHGHDGGEHGDGAAHGHHLPNVQDMPPDEGFFMSSLLSHERTGFIWQKLRAPRSYDFKLTENKPYIDRLRMPKFPFSDEQREQVITFVLGLVAEPPAAQYQFKADPRRQAVIEGDKLLTKYNCGGCHTMQMETWSFDFDPDEFLPPPQASGGEYSFVKPYFTVDELAASKATDRRGLGHATVTGMPSAEEGEDDDGNPLYFFQLWEPDAINGDVWQVGDQVPVPEARLMAKHPPVGGAFARYLHPIALDEEMQVNPNAKASDAWGWVPPPLLREGEKVQTSWMNDFLLNPYRIRPAVILRMPKFNMSEHEAQQFANYFAAKSHAEFPYEFDPRTQPAYLAEKDANHPDRLTDAMKLVTSNDYCVKCHLVGDFRPEGSPAALAPNLDQVATRIRPEFLERWLGNPARLLPYTGMPVNFPPGDAKAQDLFHGTSEQQLQAVVDLLLNYDQFMASKVSVKPMVKAPAPAESAPAAGGGD